MRSKFWPLVRPLAVYHDHASKAAGGRQAFLPNNCLCSLALHIIIPLVELGFHLRVNILEHDQLLPHFQRS